MSSTFAVVNLRDGQRRDVDPFLLNNDAFPILENAYLFRGRIERRSCFIPVGGGDGRLKWIIGTTGASPFVFALPDIPITVGIAQFTIGNVIFTDPGGASPVALLSTDPAYSGTLDRVTGVVTINHPVIAPASVFYFPGLPVMGLASREDAEINNERLVAFDTRYSYLFDIVTNDFIAANTFKTTGTVFVWEGTNSDFFWTTNYLGAMFTTNNVAGLHAAIDADAVGEGDGIRWYDGPGAIPATGWINFNPPVSSTDFLTGGLIILPYKDRLLVLNTLEGATLGGTVRFAQRARWSQNGTPFYVAGGVPTSQDPTFFNVDAWRSDIVGRGGFIDAPTNEAIVSAEFIKDTLVVYFERSTWQLVYTSNELLPFVWQKINTELGCESTFSRIPFDDGIYAVGNYGITTCNSVNVVRIDQKVPDEVFKIQNRNNGVKRVYGIRDYNAQLAFWTYPVTADADNQAPGYELTYPNQVLVYNYIDGSWAQFDDSFTCFGYFQKINDLTWATLPRSWQATQFAWNSQVQVARYPDVIAGNQRGFVMVFSQLLLNGQNSPSIPIDDYTTATRTITSPSHNFVNGDYVLITAAQGLTGINGIVYQVQSATLDTFILDGTNVIAGTYTGGGLITHIPNIYIQSKEFNPFYQNGDSVRLNYIDILMDRTSEGEISVQFYTNSQDSVALQSPTYTGLPESNTVLTRPEPLPTYTTPSPSANYQAIQAKIWHRIYTNTYGSFFQTLTTLSDAQIRDLNISSSDITIHGLVYYVSATGRISYDV